MTKKENEKETKHQTNHVQAHQTNNVQAHHINHVQAHHINHVQAHHTNHVQAHHTNHVQAHHEQHVLALLVDNEAGVLGRVVGLFSGRGYNIHSLTVSEVDNVRNLSRITITTAAPPAVIAHIVTLLERIVPVHRVLDLSCNGDFVERGLLLLKIKAVEAAHITIREIANSFSAREIDTRDEFLIFELADTQKKINQFIEQMQPYGVIEFSQTGVTALSCGSEELQAR